MSTHSKESCTILEEVKGYPACDGSLWSWSNFEECHRRRASRWDFFRQKAAKEPPLAFASNTRTDGSGAEPAVVKYIDEKEIVSWYSAVTDSEPRLKLVLVFLKETYSPFTPNINKDTVSELGAATGAPPVLQGHFLSRVGGINERFPANQDGDTVIICSSGMCWLYPQSVTIRYNSTRDTVCGYIVSDIGAFDHCAFIGISSQVEKCQYHPLLVPVLALERTLEVLCSDLEFYCIHTVRENVPLDRNYSEKVPSYQSFFFGWRGRLSAVRSTADFLARELEHQDEWMPMTRLSQYLAASNELKERVQRSLICIEQFNRYADDITGRMSAWQAGAFHKVAQEDSDFTKILMGQGRKDSSTMKFLAFLGTIFLPMTFVSSFFSMPIFNWDAPISDDFVGSKFWLWWAVTIPLTMITLLLMYLWIRLRIGRDNLESEVDPGDMKRSGKEPRRLTWGRLLHLPSHQQP